MKTVQAIFSGKVQGVGFRFVTREKAKAKNLKGKVENLANGKVKAVFQGKEEDIERIITELKQSFSIEETEILELIEKELNSFEIVL